jgi:hypothetical protein
MTKEERRQLKQRKLARDLVRLADDLRYVRTRMIGTMNATRPDLHDVAAFRTLKAHGIEWAMMLYELAAKLALPPWVRPLPLPPDEPPPPPEPPPHAA